MDKRWGAPMTNWLSNWLSTANSVTKHLSPTRAAAAEQKRQKGGRQTTTDRGGSPQGWTLRVWQGTPTKQTQTDRQTDDKHVQELHNVERDEDLALDRQQQ